jgi:hypothetical protein
MLLINLPLSFSAIVMLLIFAILVGGTTVAFWQMLTDPTEEPIQKTPAAKRIELLPTKVQIL